jgi:UDP-N-acetylmuramoylalanine--D-glutamate ligase
LRDGGFLRGRTAVLPLKCKREFTSRVALILVSNSRRELLDDECVGMKPLQVVIGCGKTGRAVTEFLLNQRFPVIMMDSRAHPPEFDKAAFEGRQVPVHLGRFDEDTLACADRIILSPGIDPRTFSSYTDGDPRYIAEAELLASVAKQPIVAITGTNGKSTVTGLVGAMAEAAGLTVGLGGNYGTPSIALWREEEPDVYVLELSSFQLEFCKTLKPSVACVLNVTADHLDRHGDMETYTQIKQSVYTGARKAVYNREDPRTKPTNAIPSVHFGADAALSAADYGIADQDGKTVLMHGDTPIIATDEIQLFGRVNWTNALAACAIADSLGTIPLKAQQQALRSFKGLDHRLCSVRAVDGVKWYNDSKGTNVGAAIAAIQGLGAVMQGKIILIAGGQAKGASFSPLSEVAKEHLKTVVVIGEAAHAIADALDNVVPVKFADSLEDAVNIANACATPGDAVLMSPACASFDNFKNYQDRGNQFTQFVKGLS